LGVRASLKEPADILIDGRKCSGNASGDIGEGVVYVGNLLINFDCEIMCNVLKTPTSLYRKCLQKAMDNNLTNLSEQVTSAQVSPEDLTSMLEKEFSGMFPLEPKCIDSELQQRAEIFLEKLTAPEWLKLEGKKRTCRKVKIAEGIYLAEHRGHNHESIMVLVKDGIITDLYALNDVKFKPYIGTQWTEDFLSLT
jgi:lipoate-protein ligase A